jgi:UDP-2,4-diacetamido-2,4,6-trideoxy-beta-L-altropyranose hydrolase
MTSPLIVFRADASLDIGTGHVMRCLTLAAALRERGATCEFVCRAHSGNLIDLVRGQGYKAHALPFICADDDGTPTLAHAHWLGASWESDAEQTRAALNGRHADWLVVDHYALDQGWERALRGDCNRLMAIDDIADRIHDCDVVLDQNLGRTPIDYAALVPAGCTILAGPRYALLRPEFSALRPYSLQRREMPGMRHLLITMGGVDRDNATGKVLEALRGCALPGDCRITVVMGPHAPWLGQVREQVATMPWTTEVLVNVRTMERLMAESDLAIGAAGSTSWERCALGLPTILMVLADNQRDIARALRDEGAVQMTQQSTLAMDLERFFATDVETTLRMQSQAARSVTSGDGTRLVAAYLMEGTQA